MLKRKEEIVAYLIISALMIILTLFCGDANADQRVIKMPDDVAVWVSSDTQLVVKADPKLGCGRYIIVRENEPVKKGSISLNGKPVVLPGEPEFKIICHGDKITINF